MNLQMDKQLQTLTSTIDTARRIVLIMHVSPDGDTCGSALALRRAFILRGKTVSVICDDPVPQIYSDVDGAADVATPDMLDGECFDLAIAVDAGDRARMGKCATVFDVAACTAQIDHHDTNDAYAQINIVRSPLSATAVLAAELIDALGIPMDAQIAHCLFIAIATDTGNFKQQNTDADALRLAARCVDAGLHVDMVTRRLFDLRSHAQVMLIARALSSLEMLCDGSLAMMLLTEADFTESGALPEHTEGIVNYGINTEGVKIACLLSERGDGIKCSLRAIEPCNVARVACKLGGGGHALAAGCTLTTSIAEANATMRTMLEKEINSAR